MTRLERMAREAAQWVPHCGTKWAADYLYAATVAEARDHDFQRGVVLASLVGMAEAIRARSKE